MDAQRVPVEPAALRVDLGRVPDHRRCPTCGYDLFNLDWHGRCPECGGNVTAAWNQRLHRVPSSALARLRWAYWCAIAVDVVLVLLMLPTAGLLAWVANSPGLERLPVRLVLGGLYAILLAAQVAGVWAFVRQARVPGIDSDWRRMMMMATGAAAHVTGLGLLLWATPRPGMTALLPAAGLLLMLGAARLWPMASVGWETCLEARWSRLADHLPTAATLRIVAEALIPVPLLLLGGGMPLGALCICTMPLFAAIVVAQWFLHGQMIRRLGSAETRLRAARAST